MRQMFTMTIGNSSYSMSLDEPLTKDQAGDIVKTIKVVECICTANEKAIKFFFYSFVILMVVLMLADTAFDLTHIVPPNPLKEFEVALGACLITSFGLSAIGTLLFWATDTLQLSPLALRILKNKTFSKYTPRSDTGQIMSFFVQCGRRQSAHFDSLATKHLDKPEK